MAARVRLENYAIIVDGGKAPGASRNHTPMIGERENVNTEEGEIMFTTCP